MTDSNKQNSQDGEVKKATIWNWVQAICTVLFVFFVLLKFYDSSFEVDFSTLLSIVLAIFSIWLSAMFYFKATETSNKFYDHTYNHSKRISELLVKIESGFGEKLSNLHENYSSIKEYMQSSTENQREDIEEAMTNEVNKIEKIKQAQDKIINDLINKANLAEQEREKVLGVLKEKEQQLKMAEENISDLKEDLSLLNDEQSIDKTNKRFLKYFNTDVIPMLLNNDDGSKNSPDSISKLRDRFRELFNSGCFHSGFITDGIKLRYFSNNGTLSLSGLSMLTRQMKMR